jgi:hypothetical protein
MQLFLGRPGAQHRVIASANRLRPASHYAARRFRFSKPRWKWMRFSETELKQAVEHLAFDVHHFRIYSLLVRDARFCPRHQFSVKQLSILF